MYTRPFHHESSLYGHVSRLSDTIRSIKTQRIVHSHSFKHLANPLQVSKYGFRMTTLNTLIFLPEGEAANESGTVSALQDRNGSFTFFRLLPCS